MADISASIIRAKIFRGDSSAKSDRNYSFFEVPANEAMTVMALLRFIYRYLDQGLAFRNYSCYIGVCSGCLVKVDGKTVRSCETLIEPGAEITIEPAAKDDSAIIRDLVTRPKG